MGLQPTGGEIPVSLTDIGTTIAEAIDAIDISGKVDAVDYINAVGIDPGPYKIALDLQGTNTGDQDLSGYLLVSTANTSYLALAGGTLTGPLMLSTSTTGAAAGAIYRNANTLRYRDSTNTERLLLNATDNLANLANTTTARTNLGLGTLATQNGTIADYATTSAVAAGYVPRITSVDNRLTRFDGTTGAVQSSGITVDDSNQMTGLSYVEINGNVKATNIRTNSILRDTSTTPVWYYGSSGNNIGTNVAFHLLTMQSGNIFTNSSGTAGEISLATTYNQTGTASSTNILVNRTNTALGSGTHRFIDLQVSGSSRFNVDMSGNVAASGTGTFASVSETSVAATGTGALVRAVSPTFTGTLNAAAITASGTGAFTANGAASTPPITATGTWFTGGTATTTKPQVLIEPTGATSTAWSTSGTGIGINAASGFTGNLIDLQNNGTTRLVLTGAGNLGIGTTAAQTTQRLTVGGTNPNIYMFAAGNTGLFLGGFNAFGGSEYSVYTESARDYAMGTNSLRRIIITSVGQVQIVTGDVVFSTVGKGCHFKSGTGQRAGNATLVAGTVTVTNTSITANSVIILCVRTIGGTVGTLSYTLSAGASFTINSSNIADTSVVSYLIQEVV